MLVEAQEARSSAGAEVEPVGVTRLVLTDFRNYREARLTIGTAPVVLTGPNGAGKTNLLEALSFLAPGRGLRGAKLTEIDRRPGSACEAPDLGWAVAAVVATRHGTLRVGTGRDSAASERRVVRIDGEPARSQVALGERLGVVWLTPLMDRLFLEGPADPAWLAALEEVMAEQGVAVAAGRRETVQRLDRACAEAEGPFPRARLMLLGTVEGWLDAMPALAAEAEFASALAVNRQNDSQTGGATIGPHRSDLAVELAEKGIAA